jgi:hypothetical protein
MLLGAVHGCEGVPSRLVKGLVNYNAIDASGDILWNGLTASHLAKAG